jgi:magnesium transporter
VLETIGDRVEDIEDELIEAPDEEALIRIFRLKRTLVYLRRAVWPLRDAVGNLLRGEIRFIRKPTLPFLRDLHDHTLRAVDLIETYRDMVSGMVDIYMSSVSNRMNDVMRVLTVIATIFIPLTFIAGVYGMNFDRMPELHWDWGYYVVWGVMVGVAVALLVYFRRRRWL